MATELRNSANASITGADPLDTESRAGLTADPDSLLAILDTIEKTVVAGARQKMFCKSPRRVGVFFH